MYVFYVVGSLANFNAIRDFSAALRLYLTAKNCIDFEVNDSWTAFGSVVDVEFWKYACERKWDYTTALRSEVCKNTFELDKYFINQADCVIMLQPCGKSAALELGYAAGIGKRTVIIKHGIPERIEVMENFADFVFMNQPDFWKNFFVVRDDGNAFDTLMEIHDPNTPSININTRVKSYRKVKTILNKSFARTQSPALSDDGASTSSTIDCDSSASSYSSAGDEKE